MPLRHPRFLIVGLLLLAPPAWYFSLARTSYGDRLLRAEPATILADAKLVAWSRAVAQPLYRQHCASCHGADRRGDKSRGVPDLADQVWVYSNSLVDLERTITYGIRSGHPKSRNIAEMPAEGRTGQLTRTEVADVVEYVLQISGQPHDADAAQAGYTLFYGKGNCFDCHANDAKGVTDYGTPALTGPAWIYGGDRQTLLKSVYDGRHGKCPAWTGTLSAAQLRALAVYLRSEQ